MLKFDKLKLVTKIDYIRDIDYSKFILNSKEDSILIINISKKDLSIS